MAEVFDYKEIIESLGYVPVSRINKRRSSYAVYKAVSYFQERNGKREQFIVKIIGDGNGNLNLWDPRKDLMREVEVLETFRGLDGIPQIVEVYGEDADNGEMVLVRRYIPGQLVTPKYKISNTKIQCKAEEIVRTLHDDGFAYLNLVSDNIILSGNKPFLIDLGSAVSLNESEVSVREFSDFVDMDLKDLEDLCD